MGRVIEVGPARKRTSRFLVDATFVATSAAFYAGTWPGLVGTRTRWETPLERDRDGRPRLFLLWHRRIWTAPALFRRLPAAARPALVAHDGLLSRVNQRCGAWSGLDVVVFQRNAALRPAAQLATFVRDTARDLLLAPDSGASPGTIRPGVGELAQATGARIVPLAVDALGAVSLRGQTLLVPGTRLVVRHGAPLEPNTPLERVRDALRALGCPGSSERTRRANLARPGRAPRG